MMTIQSTLEYLFDPETTLGALCFGVVFFVAAFTLGRFAHLWTRRVMNHKGLLINKTSYKFVGQLLQILIFLFAATIYAQLIPEFKNFGLTLLASASIVSVVFGMAAQSTIANLVAGIAILIYRPFDAGQVVTILTTNIKESGTVKEFSFGYTSLVTDDGRTILIPNSLVVTSVLVRVS